MRIANSFATGDWIISGIDTTTNRVYLQGTFATVPESLPVGLAFSIVGAGAAPDETPAS
jgi:hypothetical protein